MGGRGVERVVEGVWWWRGGGLGGGSGGVVWRGRGARASGKKQKKNVIVMARAFADGVA